MEMIDIHTHILPGVDDGASSWEIALEMCRIAVNDGTTHMVASPHSNDEYLYDRDRLRDLLNELAQKSDSGLRFSLGCDFHFSYENLVQLDKDPSRFTIDNTRYLLAEFSDYSIPPWVTEKLKQIVASGLRPIITHPERNLILQNKPGQVLEWTALGCPVQVTANALTGRWGPKASKVARWLLNHQAVHVVASDCHNVQSRSPMLSAARSFVEKECGAAVATALVHDNPLAIVENRELPYFPARTR